MERVVNNTANSGTGTLRDALENAENNDSILFDPLIFGDGGEIVVSTPLRITADVKIETRGQRVTISATGSALVTVDAAVNIHGITLVGSASISGGAVVFNRCTFGGNAAIGNAIYTTNAATVEVNDSIITGQKGRPWYLGAETSTTIRRSTIAGNIGQPNKVGSAALTLENSINEPTPSTVGFIIPPPDELPNETGPLPWRGWDLRLLSTSEFANARQGDDVGGYDRDGIPRDLNGAAGAFEVMNGAAYWLGVDEAGEPVASANWNSATGWGTSPTLNASDLTAPPVNVCILDAAHFDDIPNVETVTLGAGAVIYTKENEPETGGIIDELTAGIYSTIHNNADQINQLNLSDGAEYKGSWEEVGTTTVKEGAAVPIHRGQINNLILLDGARIELEGGELVGVEDATLNGGEVVSNGRRAYFGLDPAVDASNVVFTNVVRVPRGANVLSFKATARPDQVLFTIQTVEILPVLLEVLTGDEWQTIDIEEPQPPAKGLAYYRVCDGEKFVEDYTTTLEAFWTVEPWAVNSAGTGGAGVDAKTWRATGWAVLPEITHRN